MTDFNVNSGNPVFQPIKSSETPTGQNPTIGRMTIGGKKKLITNMKSLISKHLGVSGGKNVQCAEKTDITAVIPILHPPPPPKDTNSTEVQTSYKNEKSPTSGKEVRQKLLEGYDKAKAVLLGAHGMYEDAKGQIESKEENEGADKVGSTLKKIFPINRLISSVKRWSQQFRIF